MPGPATRSATRYVTQRVRRALKTAQRPKPNEGSKKIRQALGLLVHGPLSALLRLHGRPINLVVFQGPYSLKGMGELISRWASRLDAFSGYPVRT